ncbi:MAG: hypothetical protein Q4D88_05865 [Anaerococcus sp.]|nr:hypothetical protein [Anaerococcus sp.]
MNFKIDEKAKDFIKKKSIKEIFINPDLDQKAALCTSGVVDFEVSLKGKNKDKYESILVDDISIYYNPTMSMYFDDNEEIVISAFGLGSFKKIYIVNEKNLLS